MVVAVVVVVVVIVVVVVVIVVVAALWTCSLQIHILSRYCSLPAVLCKRCYLVE